MVLKRNNIIDSFFALIRAGLRADVDSTDLENHEFTEPVDWEKVYLLAEEQSVIGVVLAGIEQYKKLNDNLNISQKLLLQWIGEVQILEQQNKAMNQFIAELVEKLRKEDIYALLLKGQGIAQCYDRPFWRCCGDIDLFLNNSGYAKAKKMLLPIASSVEPEGIKGRHLGMIIDSWTVELHGTLYCGISGRINKVLDELQHDVFWGGDVRSWMNGKIQVFMPGASIDAFYVFTHFLNHFYKGGLGLRQVCDWCRLLWTYRDSLNHGLLKSKIKKAGLMSEWKAFGAFAVDYLGMPAETMPFYSSDKKWSRKAEKICAFIMEVGNMGHNRDNSYFEKYPYLIRKVCSMGRRCSDLFRHARIFPMDSLRFFPNIMFIGLRNAARGE